MQINQKQPVHDKPLQRRGDCMNKTPARLGKVEDNVSPLMNFESWVLLHPTAIIIAIFFSIFICGALVFAVTGHAAVESGNMRNFIASGV